MDAIAAATWAQKQILKGQKTSKQSAELNEAWGRRSHLLYLHRKIGRLRQTIMTDGINEVHRRVCEQRLANFREEIWTTEALMKKGMA